MLIFEIKICIVTSKGKTTTKKVIRNGGYVLLNIDNSKKRFIYNDVRMQVKRNFQIINFIQLKLFKILYPTRSGLSMFLSFILCIFNILKNKKFKECIWELQSV